MMSFHAPGLQARFFGQSDKGFGRRNFERRQYRFGLRPANKPRRPSCGRFAAATSLEPTDAGGTWRISIAAR
jgi:hypothetical protein